MVSCCLIRMSVQWFPADVVHYFNIYVIMYTVKKVDELVRHPHLVTQDQFSLVSEKVSGIPEDNLTINI